MSVKLGIMGDVRDGSPAISLYVNGNIPIGVKCDGAHHGKAHREDWGKERPESCGLKARPCADAYSGLG